MAAVRICELGKKLAPPNIQPWN